MAAYTSEYLKCENIKMILVSKYNLSLDVNSTGICITDELSTLCKISCFLAINTLTF